MKKRILYVSVLIVYLLTASTFLSRKIEEEMATQVLIQEHTTTSDSNRGSSMPADVLFYEDGVKTLYEVVEGEGWQGGLRLRLLDEDHWEYVRSKRDYVRFVGGKVYWFVETASRTPADGGMARIMDGFETVSDRYLLLFPEGKPDGLALPESWTVTAQTEDASLVETAEGISPFFQHRAKFLSGIYANESSSIISLREAEDFLQKLPTVALVAVILALPVALWLFCGILLAEPGKHRMVLLSNIGIAVVSLVLAWFFLSRVELPASILPADQIFAVSHYRQLYTAVFAALEKLGDTALWELALQVRKQVLGTLKVGIAAGAVLILAEILIPVIVSSIHVWNAKRYRGKYLAQKHR